MSWSNFISYWKKNSEYLNYDVIFVWLSHKFDKNWNILEAFCNSTNSWKIISQIEEWCKWVSIYKTNLVKWVPIENGKIRYPNIDEKKDWLQELLKEIFLINPKIVYLFWKQVSDYIIKNLDLEKISDLEYKLWKISFILTYHPSYIYIYRKKEVKNYIWNIISKISKII